MRKYVLITLALIILLGGAFSYKYISDKREIAKIEEQKKLEEEKRIEEERLKAEEIKRIEYEKEKALYDDAYNLFFSYKYGESINSADKLIEQYPNSYLGYNIRGIAKAYNGSFEEGMKDIDKALEINPSFGYGRFNKALNYELYNKIDDAIVWYNKALEVEDYVWTYYGLASCYGRRGDVLNTVKYLSEAIKIDGTIVEHARGEKDFNPVKNSEEFKELVK